jgi:hypothetical protein
MSTESTPPLKRAWAAGVAGATVVLSLALWLVPHHPSKIPEVVMIGAGALLLQDQLAGVLLFRPFIYLIGVVESHVRLARLLSHVAFFSAVAAGATALAAIVLVDAGNSTTAAEVFWSAGIWTFALLLLVTGVIGAVRLRADGVTVDGATQLAGAAYYGAAVAAIALLFK